MRAGAVDAPSRFVGVVVSQRLIRPLAEIVRFLMPAEGGNLQGAPLKAGGRHLSLVFIRLVEKCLGKNRQVQDIFLNF